MCVRDHRAREYRVIVAVEPSQIIVSEQRQILAVFSESKLDGRALEMHVCVVSESVV